MSVFNMIRKINQCKKSLKIIVSISIIALMFMVFCFPSTVKAASIGDVVTEVANNNISSPEFDFGTESATGLNLKAHMASGDYGNGASMIAVVGSIDESQMKTIMEHIAEVAGSTGVKTTAIKGGEVREYIMTAGIGITVVLPDYLITVEIYETGNSSSADIATAKKFAQQLVNGLDKNGLLSQPAPDIQKPVSDNNQSGQEKETSNTSTGVVVKGKALEEAVAVSNTDNIAGVKNGPTAPTTFTINVPHLVTYIRDYHWNNAKGDTPGTIALKDQNGVVYGPWQAKGTDGMGGVKNASWEVYPDVVIPAGTYTIIDSNPATWSQNQESGGRGMGQVKATPHFQVTSGSLNDLGKTASEDIDKSGSGITGESPAGVGSVGIIPGPETSTEAVVGVVVPGLIATVLAGLAGLGGGVVPPGGTGISGAGPISGGGASSGGAGGSTSGAASSGETIPQQGRAGSTSSSAVNETAEIGRKRRKTDSYNVEEPEILINEDENFNEFGTTENIVYSQEPISISVDDELIIEDGLSKDQDLIIEEPLTEDKMGNELKTDENLTIEEGIGIEIEDGLIIEDGLEIDDGLHINEDFGKNEAIKSDDGLIIEKDFEIKDSEAAGKEYDAQGFDSSEYDKEGFNEAGFDADGYDRKGYDSEGYDRQGFDSEGYDCDGFNSEGYDKEGFNKEGFDEERYNRKGYDSEGYDRQGFDGEGYDRDGFNSDGYDKEGFNKAGFDEEGYDRKGYDSEGYDKQGFDGEGYDCDGFNSEGYDKEGYNRNGYNSEGYDREGFDINGMNKKGYNRSGYDVKGYNAAGYDKEGFNRQGYDKDGYGRNGLSKDGFDREGYDKYGYDKDGYNREGYNREGRQREGLDEYGYGKDGFNKDGFDKDGYDRQGFDYEGYNRDGYDPWGYNRQGYGKDGYHWSGYNSEGYDRNGKHWNELDYDPEHRNPFDGGPISLDGSPIKDEVPKAPPLGEPYPKTAEKYGPKPWTTEPSSSKTEPAAPSSGDKIPSVSTADEVSTITPEPPQSDSGIIGPEDPMNTLKHHGLGEEGKESGLPIPEEDIPESDPESIQTSSASTSAPESSDIQQETGKIPETPQTEEVPQEPESMVITTSVHGAQTLVVKDPATGQWVDSETGAVIDLEAHQKNLEQQIKDYQDYIQRNDELEKTGQSAMQQALDKIKKDSKAEIDAIQKEIDKRHMEQLQLEQQHLEWEQQQAEKANSWGSIFAHTAANAGKDIVETAKDVKDAAVYVADTTAEAGSDALQTAKNIWEGGLKGAVQNIQDAYVGTKKVVNDTYEGTKKALKEAEEAAEDTASYIYNNPEEAWENTKTATVETGKTILKTGAAITKGVYNTITDPEKAWEFAKEQLGGNNFENALDPNRSLTSRIGQVLVGTGKLYTTILTLGEAGAVIKKGASKISGVVDDLIESGAKKTGLVDDALGAAAKKTGGKAAAEASDDVMKASMAKAQKEAQYKVESAKINVQAEEASKKADSLIDDLKKYEKQTMEKNLKDEAFVKAQKAGAEKVDKLKDASIKFAENPNSAEAKKAYKEALEAVEKDKHAMKKIEDLRDEAFWKGREEGAKKVDKLRDAQKNLVQNPDSAEARKAYHEAMEAVQKDKHAMHSLNDLETNADKLKKARSEYVKNPTDETKKAFEDAKKAAQKDLQSGDDVRKTFNARMKEKAEVADRNAKERIAREYGVKEDQVKTVGATNTMDTSGKADPRGFAKKNAGAQQTTGTEAGKYTEKDIKIGEADGKKVSYDIDKTYRVQVGEYVDPKTGVRTPIYKDIPASETKRIFGEEYYKQFHDGKLPMKLDKDGKTLIVDNDAVNKFSKEMDVSAVDHTSAEGYGGGDFDLKEMLKKDGSVKKLNDLEAGTKTIEFKANEWENQASEVREHFGDLAKAESWSEESMRQTTKQFNNQILEQIKAKNLENMAKGKNPLEVPDDLFTAVKVMEKVGKPKGGISAVEAEKILKRMGLTPKKVSEEVSSIFESMQKLKN